MKANAVKKKLNWNQFHKKTKKLSEEVLSDGFEPDLIIGILRAGIIPAVLISVFLKNKNLFAVKCDSYDSDQAGKDRSRSAPKITQSIETNLINKKVLLVDDVSETGSSLKTVVNMLSKKKPKQIKTLALYCKTWSKFKPDYFSEETSNWVEFPWNQ